MSTTDREAKVAELEELRSRVVQLERELAGAPPHWQATSFYKVYYATSGFVLGMFAAVTSLLFNIVGSALIEQHPLRLIQVYLTFPLGARALELNDGLTLTIGCCLYIATGMLLGAPFQILLAWFTEHRSLGYRILVASFLAITMWVGHFYLVLAWLQPLLFGGNWIVEQIPAWVGALTHLIYGWTMVILFPLGTYVPYRRRTEQA
jgi:hypothetical protein